MFCLANLERKTTAGATLGMVSLLLTLFSKDDDAQSEFLGGTQRSFNKKTMNLSPHTENQGLSNLFEEGQRPHALEMEQLPTSQLRSTAVPS